MDIIRLAVTAINFVLYFPLMWLDEIFMTFGLSWLGVVCGLAVVSVILRLFAANLVGTAVNLRDDHRRAQKAQVAEGKKAMKARGRGASTSSRLRRSDYSFVKRSGTRDHFINKTRKG